MKVVKPTSLVLSFINISRRSSALSASTRALRLCAFRCAMGRLFSVAFGMARKCGLHKERRADVCRFSHLKDNRCLCFGL